MNVASILSFFRMVWDVITKVWRAIVELAGIILDFADLTAGISSVVEKGKGIFKRIGRLFKIAVKDGNDVVECITTPDGEIVDYETRSQIVQGDQIDAETETKFQKGKGIIKIEM